MFKSKKIEELNKEIIKIKKVVFPSSFTIKIAEEGKDLKEVFDNTYKKQKEINKSLDDKFNDLNTKVDKLDLKFKLILKALNLEHLKIIEEKDGKTETREVVKSISQPEQNKLKVDR